MYSLLLILFFFTLLESKDIYVSQANGLDTNTGGLKDELKTLSQAVELLEAGDTIYLKEGRYPVDNLLIDAIDSVTITNFEDDKVILDGTKVIETDWVEHGDHVYKTTPDFPFWQLFIDEEMVALARYPSVDLWSDDFWNRYTFREQDSDLSTEGTMWDVVKDCEPEEQSLAGQPSFDDCIAILNTGHWWTVTSPISNHVEGTSTFNYENDVDFWFDDGHYFIECLTALDAPNEWGYDWKENTVYAWPADGVNPNDVTVRGKTSNFILNVINSNHFTLSNVEMFGGGLLLHENTYATVDNVHFNYASYHMRVLNEKYRAPGALVLSRNGGSKDIVSSNTVKNCQFEYTDGAALKVVRGKDDVIENNLFKNIDYSAAYAQGAVDFLTSTGTTFRYNTVDTTGSSETVRAGPASLLEYNYFRNGGVLQEDGAAIQVPTAGQEDTILYRNWAIDSGKIGFRFDTPSGNDKMGYSGTMQENVAFNARRGLSVKGDEHTVVGNTALMNTWNDKNDITVYVDNLGNAEIPYNFETETNYNLVGKLSGATKGEIDLRNPGDNWNGYDYDEDNIYLFNLLRDPAHGDFRPIDSTYDDYGAYEAGEQDYWIPGRKLAHTASFPLPPNDSDRVPVDVALKWQVPVEETAFQIYFGTHPLALEVVQEDWVHNVWEITTTELTLGTTYYWRIDTDFGQGTVWSFTVEEEPFMFDPTACPLQDAYVAELDALRVNLNKDKAWGAKKYKYCDSTLAPNVYALWSDPDALPLLKQYAYKTCNTWQCGREVLYTGATCDLEYIASEIMGKSASLGKIAANLNQPFCLGEPEVCAIDTHDAVENIPATSSLEDSNVIWEVCNFDLLFLEVERTADVMTSNKLWGAGDKWCDSHFNEELEAYVTSTKMLVSGLCSDEEIVTMSKLIKGDWFGNNILLPAINECFE